MTFIETIRSSDSAESARIALVERFGLSEVQAQAILDMQLRRLAGLERQRIEDEYKEIMERIAYSGGLASASGEDTRPHS